MTNRADGMVLRSIAIIALFSLATCSTKSSSSSACTDCGPSLAITFSADDAAGRRAPPVVFGRPDETAIVDVRTFAGSIPAETTAWFPTPCHGVSVRSVRPGEVTLRASARATCALAVTAGNATADVGVRVR